MDRLLQRIRSARSILDVLALSHELTRAALILPATGRQADIGRSALIEAVSDRADAPTAIAAVHALAGLSGRDHVALAADLLEPGDWLAPHLAWGLARRVPVTMLVRPLVELLADGRLGGMLAQRTMLRWSSAGGASTPVLDAIVDRLAFTDEPGQRARLIETLAAIGLDAPRLVRIATDPAEPDVARIAAVAALGDRPGGHATLLVTLAGTDGPLAHAARAALEDRRSSRRVAPRADESLHLLQVHLGGRLDRALAHAGEGDTGGVATLLVQLGDALVADARVGSVTTVGRGSWADSSTPRFEGSAHEVASIPLGRHEDASFTGTWPAVLAAERGLGRLFRTRPVGVVHLRMADVGTLAAARLARRHGIPTVFTLAPDPHAVVAEMEASGELDRARFAEADARGAIWFRARLVRNLADAAAQVALFPRPELAPRLRRLVGVDVTSSPGRYHVVPEGIDLAPIDAARADRPAPASSEGAVGAMRSALRARSAARRGLPMILSVGRLAEVKGMARLVDAFTADEDLVRRSNLVIVGGRLEDPTPEEVAEIERIAAILAARPRAKDAVVLLGHRPHDEVLRLMAVACAGDSGWVAPGGAYVCASRKEEFGLAIVEALGTGLPVVAPRVGGPPSYVEDGATGRLVDTMDAQALAAGIRDALDLAALPGRSDRARAMVRSRFTIGAMADALVPVYVTATSSTRSVAA